jgi:hypothetical protein
LGGFTYGYFGGIIVIERKFEGDIMNTLKQTYLAANQKLQNAKQQEEIQLKPYKGIDEFGLIEEKVWKTLDLHRLSEEVRTTKRELVFAMADYAIKNDPVNTELHIKAKSLLNRMPHKMNGYLNLALNTDFEVINVQ